MSEKADLSKRVIFSIGGKLPEIYSKYFSGQAYLNMLTTTGVPSATLPLNRVAGITGISIIRVDRFCW